MNNTKGIRETRTENQGDMAIGKQKERETRSVRSISKCTHIERRGQAGGWLQRSRRWCYWQKVKLCFPTQIMTFLLISLRTQEQSENNFLMFPSPNLPPTRICTHFFSFAPDTWHHLSLPVLPPCTGWLSFSPTLGLYPAVFLFPSGVIICSFSTGSYQSVYNHTEMIPSLKGFPPPLFLPPATTPFLPFPSHSETEEFFILLFSTL